MAYRPAKNISTCIDMLAACGKDVVGLPLCWKIAMPSERTEPLKTG